MVLGHRQQKNFCHSKILWASNFLACSIQQNENDDHDVQKRNYSSRANNPDSNVTCAYCNVKFKNEGSLRSHVSKAKGTKCSKLHKISGLPAKLERRQEIDAKKFVCDYCGKRYVSQESLDRHVRGGHMKIQP